MDIILNCIGDCHFRVELWFIAQLNLFVFLMFTNTKDIAQQNVICIFVEPLDPSSSPCRGRFQGRLVVCTKKLKTLVRSYQLVCEIQGEGEEEDSWGINTGGKKGGKRSRVVRLCLVGWDSRKY